MSTLLNKTNLGGLPLAMNIGGTASLGRKVRAMTAGQPHFFGYYDKCPWSADGRSLLAMQAGFQNRPPTEQDVLELGVVDVASGRFEPFAETTAWCWQQGTMLQWLPSGEVIYNARRDGQLIAVIQNLSTGQKRELSRPIYAVHPNGLEAITLNFHRLQTYRPGYGYPVAMPDSPATYAPNDDGLWRINLQTGQHELIYSIADAQAFEPHPGSAAVPNWFNHITYNTDGSRFCFLHRFRYVDRGTGPWVTRLITMNADGSEPFMLGKHEMVSHYAWRDPQNVIAWARHPAANGGMLDRYVILTDRSGQAEIIGNGVLTRDGHMTYSPDRKWLLTDEYPGPDGKQPLLLFHLETGRRMELGRFESTLKGEIRCDLHPRWNHDGSQVCFDSSHSGTRQIYVLDIAEMISASHET